MRNDTELQNGTSFVDRVWEVDLYVSTSTHRQSHVVTTNIETSNRKPRIFLLPLSTPY